MQRTGAANLFHHSEVISEPGGGHCYQVANGSRRGKHRGLSSGEILASYAHIHLASAPDLATVFLERCRDSPVGNRRT